MTAPDRRERRKQQTRAALTSAALSLFAERGISGTRISDITERADVGKGAFYNYFASKDALVAELVAQGVEVLERDYLSRMEPGDAIAERVGQIARLHGSFLDDHPQYALLFHQARGLLHLRDSGIESLREVFADYLRRVGGKLATNANPNVNVNVEVKGNGAGWSERDLGDVAAALVGGVSGYRSYRTAAALPNERTVEEILTVGVSEYLEHRGGGAGEGRRAADGKDAG